MSSGPQRWHRIIWSQRYFKENIFNFSVSTVSADELGTGSSAGIMMIMFSHYSDAIMGAIASRITSLTIIYSTVYSGADQRKHQNSTSLAFVWGIHRWPVNSPHKWPVTRKMFPFDDVVMPKESADEVRIRFLRRVLYDFIMITINHFLQAPLFHYNNGRI